MIALVADNRLVKKDTDQFAGDLRDAALNLAEGLDLHYTGNKWVLGHAALSTSDNRAIHAELAKRFASLERLTDQKLATQSKPVRIRLSSRFTHEDVAFFFGGCGGNSGHKIESELFKVTRGEITLEPEKLTPLKQMGYKVALVGEMLRDYEAHSEVFRGGIPDKRKLWVSLARDLEQVAWELADSARAKQVERANAGVHKVNNACIACHEKAGFRNSQ